MNIQVGDTVRLKKQHPCGSREDKNAKDILTSVVES